MNVAVLPPGGGAAGAFLERYEAARHAAAAPWLARLRGDAAGALRARGLPTRRVEAWRYTDLAPVSGLTAPPAAAGADPALPPARAPARAVFVDGRFRADLSEGLEALPFPVATLGRGAAVEGWLGSQARPEAEPFAAVNTALFEDGLVLDVPAGVAGGTLELISAASAAAEAASFHPRHLVRLGEGASLTLVETAAGPEGARYLHEAVQEIRVAAGATLVHARLQRESRGAVQINTAYVHVDGTGTYDGFVLNAGGRLARNEVHATLAGPRAAIHLNGAQLLLDGQHADTATAIDHAAPDCPSRQVYKTVLAGRSRGVFQGKILVRQVAQRTDGYQMNQALLLSPEAEIDSKPQLEIYADDVKCSHGATVGALDEEQLFYLRARGIPLVAARAMLVEAFVSEAIETVGDADARAALEAAVADWWRGQEAA